jgi:Holliday junction resolvasome RuvABC endonuclease subunit
MRVLGIKCSKQGIGWIVVEGNSRSDASITAYQKVTAPPAGPNEGPGEKLVWASNEIVEAIKTHKPEVAALCMSEGQSALPERSQMDGVVLATLYKHEIAVDRLFSPTIRSRFAGLKKAEIAGAVATLPAAVNASREQKELLTIAIAALPA